MHKIVYTSIFIFCWILTSQAQVYTLSRDTESSIGIGLFVIAAFDYGLYETHTVLSPTEAMQLDPQSIPGFERNTIFKRSLTADRWSDYLQFSSYALPLASLIAHKDDDNVTTIGVMLVEAIALNAGATFLTKNLFKRPRPFVFNPNTNITDQRTRSATQSFVSGHTSSSSVLGFFSASVFSRLFPDSKWKTPLWIAGTTIPAVVGLLRVEAGRHFPTDVIAGYGLGALIGILIPEQHRVDRRVKFGYTKSGGVGLVVGLN